MLGKERHEKLIQLIHDKSNDLEYMIGELQFNQKVQNDAITARLDAIELLLRDLVAKDTMTEDSPASDYYKDSNGLYSYRAHELKMREHYDRPRNKE